LLSTALTTAGRWLTKDYAISSASSPKHNSRKQIHAEPSTTTKPSANTSQDANKAPASNKEITAINDVKKIQDKLARCGFLPKAQVDGFMGYTTRYAIQSFQASNKLFVDGIPGPLTQNALSQCE